MLPPLPAGARLNEPETPPIPKGAKVNRPQTKRRPVNVAPLRPTGDVVDGDTLRLQDNPNARLYGADAFELSQNAFIDGQSVPIGQSSKNALAAFVTPGSTVADSGTASFGRPVLSVETGGQDAGRSQIAKGLALPALDYLGNDPERGQDYVTAQREAIGAEAGAYAGTFQEPAAYRKEGKDAPVVGKVSMTTDEYSEYRKLLRNPKTTPKQLETWASDQGREIANASEILSFVRRNPRAIISQYWQQKDVQGAPVVKDGQHIATRHMASVNEGIPDFLGAPVDLVNMGLGAVGVPTSDKPFFGADMIRDGFHALGFGHLDESTAPRSDIERYTQSFARGVGQAALPVGGSISLGGKLATRTPSLATQTSPTRQAVRGSLVDAAKLPAATAAAEIGGATGANLAGEAAQDFAPGNPFAQIAAQTVGGLGGGFAGFKALPGPRPAPPRTDVPQSSSASNTDLPPIPEGAVLNEPTIAMDSGIANPTLRSELLSSTSKRPLLQDNSIPEINAAAGRVSPDDVLPIPARQVDERAGNINVSKLNSPQDIQQALQVTDRALSGFDAATRGNVTNEATAALAGDLGMTADQLLSRRKGQAFNAEEALAARQILAKSGNELVNAARNLKRTDNPGDAELAAFRQIWVRHAAIQEQVSGATAEAGRALQAFRIAADSRDAPANVLRGLVGSGGGPSRLQDAAEAIVDLAEIPGALNSFSEKAIKPGFKDKAVELWYNFLLSGPQTHVVNMTSNTLTALAQIPEHAVAATLGGARRAVSKQAVDRVLFSEVGARATGLLQGIKEGLPQMVRTFRTGEPSDAVTKVEDLAQKAIPGKTGELLRVPTRALAAEDELFKAMARRMELSGLAVRRAKGEGLKGEAAKKRVAELIANPPDAMLQRTMDYGRYLTFTKPLSENDGALSALGSMASRATERVPALKAILPFVRTPTNLIKFSLERSPFAPAMKDWRRDFRAGGAKRDLAVAKAMVGTGIAATIAEYAAEGKITGSPPADGAQERLLRADGWQPYSFVVGDKYYSYLRLDPFASMIGTSADIATASSGMTDKQRENGATLTVASILSNIGSKTWLSGISDALAALKEPERNLEYFAKRLAGSATVPTGVAQVARTLDPTFRDTETIPDYIKSRVPGGGASLPAKRDFWGQPIVGEGGLGPDAISPIWQSTRKNDPITNELIRVGVRSGPPQQKDMTGNEYAEFQERAGALAKQRIGELMQTPAYKAMSDEDKNDEIKDLIRDSRKAAKAEMFGGNNRKGSSLPPVPEGAVLNENLPPLPAGAVVNQ